MMLIKGWKMENKFVNLWRVERYVVEKNVKKWKKEEENVS